jgi:hypothetical protein
LPFPARLCGFLGGSASVLVPSLVSEDRGAHVVVGIAARIVQRAIRQDADGVKFCPIVVNPFV